MAPRILIATSVSWPSAALLSAAFGAAGCHVEAFAPRGHVLSKSRHVARVHAYDGLLPQRALAAAILDSDPDLVVPCDDRMLEHMLGLWRKRTKASDRTISWLLERSLGMPTSYFALLSRAESISIARNLGIVAPRTRRIASLNDLESALKEIGAPCVLKTDGSWGGGGVAIANNLEEAHAAFLKLGRAPSRVRSALRAITRRDANFLRQVVRPRRQILNLQQFVEGRTATSSIACWRGQVLAALHFDVIVARDGTGPSSVLERVDDAEMDKAARLYAERFRLSGLHGLDFVRDADGQVHLIEVNPRATQTSHLALGWGRDLVTALVAALDIPGGMRRAMMTENKLIALFPQEWVRDPGSPWLHLAYHDLPWDDPVLLRALVADQADGLAAAAGPAPGSLEVWLSSLPASLRNATSEGSADQDQADIKNSTESLDKNKGRRSAA